MMGGGETVLKEAHSVTPHTYTHTRARTHHPTPCSFSRVMILQDCNMVNWWRTYLILPQLYCTLVILNTHTRTHLNKKFSYPTVNAAEDWLKWKPAEPEGWAEAAGALGPAPNVNTPNGLLLVKLKFVVVLLPNWKPEPEIVEAEKLH